MCFGDEIRICALGFSDNAARMRAAWMPTRAWTTSTSPGSGTVRVRVVPSQEWGEEKRLVKEFQTA